MWTKLSFFCAQGFTFCISLLLNLSFIYALFLLNTHTQFMNLLFSELIRTEQEAKLFGPAFSSPAIWSVIGLFQVPHFPRLAFSVAVGLHGEVGLTDDSLLVFTKVA